MTNNRPGLSGGRIRLLIGLGLAAAFCIQNRGLFSGWVSASKSPGIGATPAEALPTPMLPREIGGTYDTPIHRMAHEAPLDLLREAQKRYRDTVVDYTCFFTKQENLFGRMTAVQGADVKFRDQPFSIFMHWTQNPDKARRVCFVSGKWTTKDGQAAALCEPEGAIARTFISKILRPIHGADAKAASRRTIDQFGFGNTLHLIVKYAMLAHQRGELQLVHLGDGEVDGRPTYVFERRLPYTGEDGVYPDRVLVFHLDKETLLPVMCASYADDAKQELLGQYTYTKVRLNVGLTDASFEGIN
jgi:hypothetical protein